MKVLFCIDHLRADGTQRVLCQLAGGLVARGHQVAAICLNDSWDDAVVRDLRQHGVALRVVGRRSILGLYGLVGLLAWVRYKRFDVAVTLLFVADVLGRPLARAAGVPRLISSIRARNINYGLWHLLLIRATMPLADAVVVNSLGTRVFAVGAEGARPNRLVYIPNGVNVDLYAQPYSPVELRAMFGIPKGKVVIGCVGRLTEQKGQDLLLRAVAQLERDDLDLMLVGEGEDEPKLRNLAAQLGLDGRAHFVGYRRDVARILGALDLYVHPARFEGMPNALLEAMAAGCPIVASAADGSGELLGDGASGWLVPVSDVPALAAAIGAALGDQVEARRRGGAARERAKTCYSVQAMVEAWERILLIQ
jgi:glycosyltransferase involved in cell wall biosynthesis